MLPLVAHVLSQTPGLTSSELSGETKVGACRTQAAISLQEYLRHILDLDVKYVDGQLKERPVVTPIHSLIQSEICFWFGLHRRQWKLLSGIEVRT